MNEETAQTNETVETETTEVLDSTAVSQDEANDSNGNAEVNEETFEDGNNDAETSKEQSKEENAKFAKERREREKVQKAIKEKEAEAQRKRELEKVRLDAIKETLGGVNPYTNQKIEDDFDMQEYLVQKEMASKGLDPVQDYSSYLKQMKREEIKKETIESEKRAKDDWLKNDKADFLSKYPDVNLKELSNDEMFKKFLYGKIGNVPMASIYEGYMEVKAEIDKKAKEVATRMVANQQASPGSLSSNTDTENAFYTLDQLKKLSKEEVRKNYEKVIASEKRLRGK